MRTPGIILAAAAAASVAACASTTLKTSADYDRSADFSKYRTFAIRDTGEIRNDLMERRIKNALSAGLVARGLREDATSPDLWVVPHVRLTEDVEIHSYNTGWGYGWRWRAAPSRSVATVEKIPVGTLIVDLVDANAKELVWRGTASDTLKPKATPEEKEQALSAAISKMLATFPPAT